MCSVSGTFSVSRSERSGSGLPLIGDDDGIVVMLTDGCPNRLDQWGRRFRHPGPPECVSEFTNSSRSFHSQTINPVSALRMAACSPGASFPMVFSARTSSTRSSLGSKRSCKSRSTVMAEYPNYFTFEDLWQVGLLIAAVLVAEAVIKATDPLNVLGPQFLTLGSKRLPHFAEHIDGVDEPHLAVAFRRFIVAQDPDVGRDAGPGGVRLRNRRRRRPGNKSLSPPGDAKRCLANMDLPSLAVDGATRLKIRRWHSTCTTSSPPMHPKRRGRSAAEHPASRACLDNAGNFKQRWRAILFAAVWIFHRFQHDRGRCWDHL